MNHKEEFVATVADAELEHGHKHPFSIKYESFPGSLLPFLNTEVLPPAMVSAEFLHDPIKEDKHFKNSNGLEIVPYINVRIFASFLKEIRQSDIVVIYYVTDVKLTIKIIYGLKKQKPTTSNNDQENASAYWLIRCKCRIKGVENIESVYVVVHDHDPETSRGTETGVQHG
jgi:hypothetical protein